MYYGQSHLKSVHLLLAKISLQSVISAIKLQIKGAGIKLIDQYLSNLNTGPNIESWWRYSGSLALSTNNPLLVCKENPFIFKKIRHDLVGQ